MEPHLVGEMEWSAKSRTVIAYKTTSIHVMSIVRLADCNGMTSATLNVTGQLDGVSRSIAISIPMNTEERDTKADLTVNMYANCSDVYPGDEVQLDASVSHTTESSRECDSLNVVLHNGPWIKQVTISTKGTKSLERPSDEIRRKELMIGGFLFEDKLFVRANVLFSEQIVLPNNAELKLVSFTLEVKCLRKAKGHESTDVVSMATANVVLHTKRGVYANLVVPTSKDTKNCRFSIGGKRIEPHSRADAVNSEQWKMPTHTPIFTISLGMMTTFHFVRVHLQAENVSAFKSKIMITKDGWSHMVVEQPVCAWHQADMYSCVFERPIRARGLEFIPKLPVTKSRILIKRLEVFGRTDEKDVRQYDLGKMVSQVILYQEDGHIFIGIGPERQSIVASTDLLEWTGWSFSTYRHYTEGKTRINATYVPWDETDDFNKQLTGAKCTRYRSGKWSVCYNGLYYDNEQVGVWGDALAEMNFD